MKKSNANLLGLGLMLSMSVATAGTMGPIATNHEITPFVSAEGFPVWIKFGGVQVVKNGVIDSADAGTFLSGGARVAAGLNYSYTPRINFTLESGWNYFGQTTGAVSGASIGAKLYGADLLIGASYKLNKFNLLGYYLDGLEAFGKAGTLFERTDISTNIPNTYLLNSNGLDYYVSNKSNSSTTEFLPEIKVGFNYNFLPNLAATVSYMHAFGSVPSLAVSSQKTSTQVFAGVSSNLRAPTLDAIMLGLIYQFK